MKSGLAGIERVTFGTSDRRTLGGWLFEHPDRCRV